MLPLQGAWVRSWSADPACWTTQSKYINRYINSSVSHLRRQWHPTPVLLPGKSHGQRTLVGCSPWGREESDITERLHFHFSLSCIGEGNGNPFQCSCLENPRDRRAWWAAVYGVAQSQTRLKRLSSVSHSVVSDSLWPHGLQSARLLCPWNSPGKNTGVGCHSLLQRIFLTQGSNPGLLHCRQILYHRSYRYINKRQINR